MSHNMVAVIGEGPAGLPTIKNFLDLGFDVTAFDRCEDVGGNWRYNDTTGHSNVFETTPIIAIAVRHPKWDERPLVVCVTTPGSPVPTTRDLSALYAHNVQSWQVPDYTFVDQLPLGATGKVLKAELRKRYADFHTASQGKGKS